MSSKEAGNNPGLLKDGSWTRARNHLSNLSLCTDKNPCTTL